MARQSNDNIIKLIGNKTIELHRKLKMSKQLIFCYYKRSKVSATLSFAHMARALAKGRLDK